mgnify:CR=1 FL=1
MSYDVSRRPPRSVEIERRVSDWYDRNRGNLNTAVFVAGMLGVGYHVLGEIDPSETSSTAVESAAQLTISDIGLGVAALVGLWVAHGLIVSLHELCHVYALRILGIDSDWHVNLIGIDNAEISEVSGICIPRPFMRQFRSSYAEDVFVSLAPLALAAGMLGVFELIKIGLGIGPGVALETVLLVLVIGGPSPSDWGSLWITPRRRWERLVEFEQRVETHGSAEGISA